MIGNISQTDKKKMEDFNRKFEIVKNISYQTEFYGFVLHLPTCPLALAEAQRYLLRRW